MPLFNTQKLNSKDPIDREDEIARIAEGVLTTLVATAIYAFRPSNTPDKAVESAADIVRNCFRDTTEPGG